MSAAAADRVYAARRIDSGIYLQPSNDGTRFFVIARYQDGRAHGLDHGPELATFWAWGPISEPDLRQIERTAGFDSESALSDLRYAATGHDTGYATKREAVEAALRA